jgi:hypothetical protein
MPKIIKGNLIADYCFELTSLEDGPMEISNGFFYECEKISSLEGIGKNYLTKVRGKLYLPDCIKSNILGLLKVKELQGIHIDDENGSPDEFLRAISIINNHLKSGRRLTKCREELIEAGLKDYAKL